MTGLNYMIVLTIFMSCSISQGNSYEAATILEEVGAVFHPIGRLITSQDRLFVHIAIPRPNRLSIPGRIVLEKDCGMPDSLTRDAQLVNYMRKMCLEFYTAMTIYNKTAESVIANIDSRLLDINASLGSIPKTTETGKTRRRRFISGLIGNRRCRFRNVNTHEQTDRFINGKHKRR